MITAVCSRPIIAAEVAPGATIADDEHGFLLIDEVRSTRDGLTLLGFPPYRSSGPRIAVRCEPGACVNVVANRETVVTLLSSLELFGGGILVTEVLGDQDAVVLRSEDPTDWTLRFDVAAVPAAPNDVDGPGDAVEEVMTGDL